MCSLFCGQLRIETRDSDWSKASRSCGVAATSRDLLLGSGLAMPHCRVLVEVGNIQVCKVAVGVRAQECLNS